MDGPLIQPDRDRPVAIWLLICCGLVFCMIVLGGVTRLTGSGLSMADWRPLIGWLPPLSDADWQRTFELYQQTPEYQKVNAFMDVHDFKGIFWLEYLHRLLGRLIGLAFALPCLIFVIKGHIPRAHWPRYVAMFLLGGLQGILGWYMVRSGLVDDPQVSQYRLTSHLVAALLIYALMLWVALSLLHTRAASERHAWFGRTIALTAIICLTIISGGFVAGLDAGMLYNTFPTMLGAWIPPGLTELTPWWRNLFENRLTVQFDHRILAVSAFLLIAVYWSAARRIDFPQRARGAANALLGTAGLQVVLGITTLLLVVPIPLAAAHQAVAVLLFTVALYLVHSLR